MQSFIQYQNRTFLKLSGVRSIIWGVACWAKYIATSKLPIEIIVLMPVVVPDGFRAIPHFSQLALKKFCLAGILQSGQNPKLIIQHSHTHNAFGTGEHFRESNGAQNARNDCARTCYLFSLAHAYGVTVKFAVFPCIWFSLVSGIKQMCCNAEHCCFFLRKFQVHIYVW